jgi:mannan endo-1,6-alpha-mannosidase
VACETTGKCDTDQYFFKGQLAQSLARTAQIAPFTAQEIQPLLANSAKAAASIGCAKSGEACTWNWNSESDAESSLGSQYSALQAIQANLVAGSKAPATSGTSNSSGPASGASGSASGSAASASPSKGEAGGFVVQSGCLTALVVALAVFSLL